MNIETAHQSISVLFEQNPTFEVPKYQREYAWDPDAIEDFVEDLKKCLEIRLRGRERNHFFGGIVSARLNVPGSSRPSYEVIDGQQRIASFVMLAAAVVLSMSATSDDIESNPREERDEKALNYLKETVSKIDAQYLTHRYAVGLEYRIVPKLTLSKIDNDFFQAVVTGNEPEPQRPSHERIQYAWNRLKEFLADELAKEDSASGKATRLQHLIDHVLAEDCTVIFMWSDDRSVAYRIFQVLNDRGVNLTNGDLLRARTLELLDHPLVAKTQEQVADRWDSTLAYTPSSIDDFLLWYFASYEGYRPKKSEVPDSFMRERFRELLLSNPITQDQATRILGEVIRLDDGFSLLNQLVNGEWPFGGDAGVSQWDVQRLNFLVGHLKHTNAMPLLMALQLLGPKKFAEGVASLERFVFRYKTIGNAHIGPATKVYHEHACLIRSDPSAYKVGALRAQLRELIKRYSSGKRFSTAISELSYSPRGGNGDIRYLLLAIEDYYQWYDDGAHGTPVCKDKTRVLDIASTTLEHVYPQRLEARDRDADLETVKHTLGNLTMLGSRENIAMGNRGFSEKLASFKKSNLRMNRKIAENENWTLASIEERTIMLSEMAERIFVP